tara:strand:+ start:561 stop:869 length:309 start_codon:yes stop_codon:yes gene_type:complete
MQLPTKGTAIKSINPNAKFSYTEVDGADVFTWYAGTTPISDADINAKLTELQTAYDALDYSRDRILAYPSIGDQMDMQYKDLLNGTTTWKDAVAKVKSDNPK